jgi:hypothetical protein
MNFLSSILTLFPLAQTAVLTYSRPGPCDCCTSEQSEVASRIVGLCNTLGVPTDMPA